MCCRMTAGWNFFDNFSMHFTKKYVFPMQRTELCKLLLSISAIFSSKKINRKVILVFKKKPKNHAIQKTFHARFSFLHAIRI